MNSTIAAISTPSGSGAIAVVRMSGEKSLNIANQLFRPFAIESMNNAEPYKMYLGIFTSNKVKDKCLCVYFKAPFSYTGEDIVEIHCHGGAKLAVEILSALIYHGCVRADKGEFSRRAFFNNKLSLSQAEGIIDIINAESLSQINGAYSLQSGVLTAEVNRISNMLVDATAHLEVILDSESFEDEMIAVETTAKLCDNADDIIKKLLKGQILNNKYARDGVSIAIVGQSNMGKSSLLNCLCGYNRAIVTDIAGTTRDIIEEKVEYNGFLFRFIDTAGIRESTDKVEEIGIGLALSQAESCDVVLVVADATKGLEQKDIDIITKYRTKPILVCINKVDLTQGGVDSKTLSELSTLSVDYVRISALSTLNNKGIDILLEKIAALLKLGNIGGGIESSIKERHATHLKNAHDTLSELLSNITSTPIDCILSELYNVISELKCIEGADANDIVIDTVFSKFCVGK